MTEAIDWGHAARRAAFVAKAGPPIDRPGLIELVGSLRASAADAPAYVADVTGLDAAAEVAAEGTVFVVDRARWSQAATDTFRAMVGDALPPPRIPGAARLAGEQAGLALGLLSTRVLGQFDPYVADVPGTGRLLLVAPNVLAVQRQLDADAADFHLWVCLHEQTHAVQFAAAPWLAEHLAGTLRSVVRSQFADGESSPPQPEQPEQPERDAAEQEAPAEQPTEREPAGESATDPAAGEVPDGAPSHGAAGFLTRVVAAVRTDSTAGEVPGLLEALLQPEQREELARAIATMSLLEGHADVVMDEVGPRAVPTVRSIRESFEKRRDERTLTTMLLRRLLGMDAKLLQYRNGAAFVRGVRDRVGHAGLNAVWTGPEHLPSPAEIAEPEAWVRRVHG